MTYFPNPNATTVLLDFDTSIPIEIINTSNKFYPVSYTHLTLPTNREV